MQAAMSADPGWVLAKARDYLAAEPVLCNLILTLLHERAERPEPGRYWVVTDGPVVVGVGFQSPLSFPLIVTPMNLEAVSTLVDAIARDGIALPGVNAEAATAARCAGQWTERCGVAASPVVGIRIYACDEVRWQGAAQGRLRQALPEDRDLLIAWTRSFQTDVREPGGDPQAMVDRQLGKGRFWLWEDGEPASMAAHSAPLAGVVRVQAVFTPPEKRSRGYAGACVGHLSKMLLAGGHRCMLYTALNNATSNSIYRRIGYRAIAEGLRYSFG